MSHPSRRVPAHPTPRTADPGRCPSCGASGAATYVTFRDIECSMRSCPRWTASAEQIVSDRVRSALIRAWQKEATQDATATPHD